MDSFATHMATNESFIKAFQPQSIFEFGMGRYSTPLFVQACLKTVSVEMQEASWYNTIIQELKDADPDRFLPVLALDRFLGCHMLEGSPDNYDLVFVDGHGYSRWAQVAAGYSKSHALIVHDTEAHIYEWSRVNIPEGWSAVELRGEYAWTTVLTDMSNIVDWAMTLPEPFPFTSFAEKGYAR